MLFTCPSRYSSTIGHTGTAPAAVYQIDLAPTGKMISVDVPLIKGNTYLFHAYPSGTLQSLRKADVVRVTKVAPATAAPPADTLVQIGNLAMQGGSTQAGPTNARAVVPKQSGPELGQGFYSNLKFGQSLAPDAAASGDYQIGRSYAAPPSSGVQSSPGAPPTMPSATSGANPPTMSSADDGTNPH